MRWILRHLVFALCFSVGSTAWYLVAQQESTTASPVQAAQETSNNQIVAQTAMDAPLVVPGHSIKFGPVEPMMGYANTETIILRESADANSPIVAKVKRGEYEQALILGATRDFVRVKIAVNESSTDDSTAKTKDYEGWTTWGSIVPEMSAIVLDTETGAVVSRVPLSDGLASVIFSPDGSRAIFTGEASGYSQRAYEVRTSDYTLTRSLMSSENETFSAAFYAPANGDIYARVYADGERLIRIGDGGAENTATDITPNIIISPDGLTGLIVRREGADGSHSLRVDVMEMATLQVRYTFNLSGSNLSEDGSGFVLSKDGAELYLQSREKAGAILVYDTRTGQLLRELPDSATSDWSYFGQSSIVGDSVLLTVRDEGDDETNGLPSKFWISNGKRMLAEEGVDYAVEAGGKRYAVNEEGTQLFRLNDNNRIQKRFKISRPEQREDAETGNSLTVFGLSASPDGKHVILFVGMMHGC